MPLQLYNSLSGKKEDFIPSNPDHVRMYTCGPTVYNYAHIGNARPPIVSDILVRLLRNLYKKVTYVSNITDIYDKIIRCSIPHKVSWDRWQDSRKYYNTVKKLRAGCHRTSEFSHGLQKRFSTTGFGAPLSGPKSTPKSTKTVLKVRF